jgi:acyl-CoA synthetase (AMP-forming)/AMP-acid ligase II
MHAHAPAGADVVGFLRRAARVAPAALAVGCPDYTLDYAQLLVRVERLAQALRDTLGDARSEPVAVIAEHDPAVPELYLGVMAAGHAVVPLSARLPDEAIARVVSRSGSRLGILSPSVAGRLKGIAATADTARWVAYGAVIEAGALPLHDNALPAGTAMVCFTSGTTGEPKGVLLTHLNLVVHGLTASTVYRLQGESVNINPMPLAHLAGASRVVNAIVNAGAHVILPGFDPDALFAAVTRWNGTHLMVVPTMVNELLAREPERHDLSSLRMLTCGTAPLPMPVARQLVTRMRCGIVNGYGLTESSALATSLGPEAHARAVADGNEALLGSIGQCAPGVELRILGKDNCEVPAGELGQIALRGLKISPGYLNNPAETAARFLPGGWLLTGDQGRLLAGDNVALIGRLDEMIISGGLNVQPGEIEREAVLMPGLAQCAAFGVPSERWGREVRLAVVPAAGVKLDPESVRQFLRTRLDPYKVPKQVHVVDELPRTAVGKVQRFRLAETWGESAKN